MARYILLIILLLVFLVRWQLIDKTQVSTEEVNIMSGLRLTMQKNLQKWLPGDTGPLASGILLGGNDGLSWSGKTVFRSTGLMHVTAASGYNVVVVYGWLMVLGIKLIGRRKAIWVSIAGVLGYMLLAGWSAAVVRAGIMAILSLSALYWGRKSDAGWILILASLIMLIVNPMWIGNIGFQLSVAATAGLIWFSSKKSVVIADLQTTVAAQIATIPLILHYFGSLSVISPIVNLSVLWTIPLIMQITAIASVVGLLVPELGRWIAWLAWPALRYLEGMVEWAATWPGANLQLGNPGWLWVGLYYVGIAIFFKPKKNETVA